MSTKYETDVVAWADEQAAYIRSGQFDKLDRHHLAEEILDVGKSEQRELASRMAVLLGHLLKWQVQPERRDSVSWSATMAVQRASIERRLRKTPSLRPLLDDADWIADVWGDALLLVVQESRVPMSRLPESCPWLLRDVLTEGWHPA